MITEKDRDLLQRLDEENSKLMREFTELREKAAEHQIIESKKQVLEVDRELSIDPSEWHRRDPRIELHQNEN